MRLRNKLISVVAVIMFIILCILMLSVLSLSLISENNRRRELELVLRNTAPLILENYGISQLNEYLDAQDWVKDWRISENGNVISGKGGKTDKPVDIMYMSVTLAAGQSEKRLYFIVATNPVLRLPIANFVITGFAGTAVLIVILYLMLSRLVIKPIELVIEASRNASLNIKPGVNPIPGRRDEAGKMVSEFHSLLAETWEYRQNMEEKIKEARSEIEAAQKSLALSERLSATGKLAAGIAHEINNPLGGMLNAVARLRKSAEDEKQIEYYELLEECIHRIENLVKELLSFVRSETDHEPTAIAGCIEFAHRMAKHALEEKHITFTCDADESIEIAGSSSELKQLLLNLFLNAIDSMEDKGTLTVALNKNKTEVQLTVTDNGCGIPDDQKSEVFDLFYTTKEAGKGTGLGLSIVHSIIKNHGGSIEIEDAPEKGTRIILTFPELKE